MQAWDGGVLVRQPRRQQHRLRVRALLDGVDEAELGHEARRRDRGKGEEKQRDRARDEQSVSVGDVFPGMVEEQPD